MKMATLDAPEPVNLVRSIFLCNLFNFMLTASKACLLPFLTIYLKRLGLSATQTGWIIGAKTLVGLVFAPLWSKCAVRCGRRRCVLMFSIFVMAATYLSLTAVPSMDEEAFAAQCEVEKTNFNVSHLADTISKQTTTSPALSSTKDHPLNLTTPTPGNKSESIGSNTSILSGNDITTSNTSKIVQDIKTTGTTVATSIGLNSMTTVAAGSEHGKKENIMDVLKQILLNVGMSEKELKNMKEKDMMDLINALETTDTGKKLLGEALEDLSPEAEEVLSNIVFRKKRAVALDPDTNEDSNSDDGSESAWRSFRKKLILQLEVFRESIGSNTSILSGNDLTSSNTSKIVQDIKTTGTTVATSIGLNSMTTVAAGSEHGKKENIMDVLKQILLNVGMSEKELKNMKEKDMMDLINALEATDTGKKLLVEALEDLSPEAEEVLSNIVFRKKRAVALDPDTNEDSNSDDGSESSYRSFSKKLILQLEVFREHICKTENEMFVVILVILMVGECMSCPVEKIADDGWFEFLESIDDMEKYGMQRIWSTFAYILMPIIVTLIVDNTNCLFGMSIHPFMLHFYLFGGFLGLTLLLAFFYPMVTSEKYKYASKVMKGMRVVCCNMRSFVFTVTLLIMGVIHASYYNFLFWLLFEMGSKEITFGVCLMIAALAEIPMLLFNDSLIKKIGNGGVVSLSVLFLSARCLYYSFLSTPWAVIPAEVTHAFTHTAMWWAVLSSPSFNNSPALSRSIRSILSSVYFGFGFAFGSVISGAIYETYGAAILFQAGAVLSIGWFPVLCLSVRCCREKDRSHVKYTRLLNSDDASDTDSIEDDWLEQALKDR